MVFDLYHRIRDLKTTSKKGLDALRESFRVLTILNKAGMKIPKSDSGNLI